MSVRNVGVRYATGGECEQNHGQVQSAHVEVVLREGRDD